ncbi:PKD domain-containing protein [Arthrobacter burdickii]|uniref:PKD domain-containing protein n=1 Tax=Arthrobacter burdickii TaxID=3035920 RepID=A0ABT8JXG6_9MICC|nr:PKD domain-containing protein [Arthrobacter burdickii]MDN4609870.1 PKD domain-containing protein [Arthrobacter burdickii]
MRFTPTHRKGIGAAAATLLLGTGLSTAAPALAASPECATIDSAMQVTADCLDPTYRTPVIDSETDETLPTPHHRVRGHFEGTNIQFTIYLHAQQDKAQWDGRFFQFTYPVVFGPGQDTSKADDRAIGFALSSGGYAVQAGNASFALGYRHAAAAAKFAEQVAAKYYGSNRPIYGYLYGPSGGSFQTIGAAENSTGVWEGYVPMVQAIPQPTSYNFLGRAAAQLILEDKADEIRAALLPGGSGDPYATLDEAERTVLREVHALGIPWKGWEYPDFLLGRTGYQSDQLDQSRPLANDPTYVDDFWSADGYLGTEDSPLGDRIRAELAEVGDTVAHRWNIANRFYYRYLLPAADEGFVGLDQFRHPDGTPLYPQRAVSIAPYTGGSAGSASGNTAFDGSVNGKVIAVANLYDTDALPWHTDWYRQRIEATLGDAAAGTYRVYFNDHADHQDAPVAGERAKHLVNWYGMAEQALRDVAAWVEDGVAPPASTQYEISDAQVLVPDNAAARRGIQPTVDLTAQGKEITTTQVGQSVRLKAKAQVPPDAGKIVRTEWDLDGDGVFTDAPVTRVGNALTFQSTVTFDEPGTYLVALRVSSERNGDPTAHFALAQNLDRVQVVVTPSR